MRRSPWKILGAEFTCGRVRRCYCDVVSMRRFASSILLVAAGAAASAHGSAQERITIPAAASIVGLAPFFSDVRVFNRSYSSPAEVTATYRCFLGSCPAASAPLTFTLAPRETRAFDDMVAAAFQAPNSAGGVELSRS